MDTYGMSVHPPKNTAFVGVAIRQHRDSMLDRWIAGRMAPRRSSLHLGTKWAWYGLGIKA